MAGERANRISLSLMRLFLLRRVSLAGSSMSGTEWIMIFGPLRRGHEDRIYKAWSLGLHRAAARTAAIPCGEGFADGPDAVHPGCVPVTSEVV